MKKDHNKIRIIITKGVNLSNKPLRTNLTEGRCALADDPFLFGGEGAQGSGSNQHVLRSHDDTAPTLADLGVSKPNPHSGKS
jgi:hypothetical protein